MDFGALAVAEMIGGHHPVESGDEAALWIGQEGRDARERLLLLGIEDVEDRADQQRMTGLLPVIAAFERALGIDEDIGDVLDVAHLVDAAPDFEQRIVMRGCGVSGIEEQAMRETCAPAGGQRPVLAFDVMDDGRAGPRQQGRDDKAHALARSRRRERHDVLGAVMAEIAAGKHAEHDARIAMQPGALDLAGACPTRRTISGDVARLARAPQRSADRRRAADETAGAGQHAGLVEDDGGVGVIVIPPAEQRPGTVDRHGAEPEPGQSQFGLVGKHCCRPLRRGPHPRDHDREDDKNLADEQFGGRHVEAPARRTGSAGADSDSVTGSKNGTALMGADGLALVRSGQMLEPEAIRQTAPGG